MLQERVVDASSSTDVCGGEGRIDGTGDIRMIVPTLPAFLDLISNFPKYQSLFDPGRADKGCAKGAVQGGQLSMRPIRRVV